LRHDYAAQPDPYSDAIYNGHVRGIAEAGRRPGVEGDHLSQLGELTDEANDREDLPEDLGGSDLNGDLLFEDDLLESDELLLDEIGYGVEEVADGPLGDVLDAVRDVLGGVDQRRSRRAAGKLGCPRRRSGVPRGVCMEGLALLLRHAHPARFRSA
jgi:hypothetical protein